MTLHPARTQWMLPPKSWEPAEVGVGRYHGAAVLQCNRRVLGVGDQLSGGAGLAAQSLEYVQMIGTGTHDARGRALHERGHERERPVESGGRVEDPGVGYHANEAGQNEDGEGERFRPRRQTGDPGRILGVFGDGVLDVRIYQGRSHREAASRISDSHARNGSRHPVRRAPSSGPGPLRDGDAHPGRSPIGRAAAPMARDASERHPTSLEMKALTLMPRASAARRTCFASWSSREIVVLMMHYHNISSSVHQHCQTHHPLTPHSVPRTRCRTRPFVHRFPTPPRRGRPPRPGASAACASTAPWRRPARSLNLASISTASANSSGHLRLVSTHRRRDWKGQATQAETVPGACRSGLPTSPGSPLRDMPASMSGYHRYATLPNELSGGLIKTDRRSLGVVGFVIHLSREVFMGMASSVEMPSHSSTIVPVWNPLPPPRVPAGRVSSCADGLGRDGAANGRNAPAGLRHPPHRTGRAPFKASGSPSDGLDLCVGNIGFSAIVVGFIHPSSGVVRFVPHPSDCPPSPCGRLSRPRTTTRALPHIRHWPKAGLLRRRRAGRGSQVRPGCVCVPS